MQLDAAPGGADDRRQGRRRALPDLETKSTPGKQLLDTLGVGMFPNKIGKRGSWRSRLRGMRRGSPIDEERDDAVGNDDARVRVAPVQQHAIRPAAASGQDLAQLDGNATGTSDRALEVAGLGG